MRTLRLLAGAGEHGECDRQMVSLPVPGVRPELARIPGHEQGTPTLVALKATGRRPLERTQYAEQFLGRMNSTLSTPAPQKAEPAPPAKLRWTRDDFRRWLVTKHFSPRTVDTYVSWAIDFVRHHKRPPDSCGPSEVNAWLTHLANERHVTAKTQTQALCSIVRLFECMGMLLG